MSEYKIITSDFLKVNVSNSQNDVISFERKFDKGMTILDLKVYDFSRTIFFLIINFFTDKIGNSNWGKRRYNGIRTI